MFDSTLCLGVNPINSFEAPGQGSISPGLIVCTTDRAFTPLSFTDRVVIHMCLSADKLGVNRYPSPFGLCFPRAPPILAFSDAKAQGAG